MKFLIVTCGWRCSPYIRRCMDSVLTQEGEDWVMDIRLDGATEEDVGVCNTTDERIERRVYGIQYGAACHIWQAIQDAQKRDGFCRRDVVCLLDADDQLAPGALGVLSRVYADDGIWLTHGSYVTESGAAPKFNGETPDDMRKAPWRVSHLKTFRIGLANHLQKKDMMKNGVFLRSCSDLALMFPLVELAGLDRVRYVKETTYIYNDTNPANDHKINRQLQVKIESDLRRRPKKERLSESCI